MTDLAGTEPDAPPNDSGVAEILARLDSELGDAIVETAASFGVAVVRVRPDAWSLAARVARDALSCDFFSFVSGIDWMPVPKEGGADAASDTSAPVQPAEMTFGAAGSAGRFQVFAYVQSTSRHHGVVLKADVDEATPVVESLLEVYPGADWHERECSEMFGFDFVGRAGMRKLLLPSEFEGHPLRKDFPLLARVVKPWPGLVDVEGMPGADDDDSEGESE